MATVVSMIETETVLQECGIPKLGRRKGLIFILSFAGNETRSSEVLSTVDAQV
jgi:hypothetical protein